MTSIISGYLYGIKATCYEKISLTRPNVYPSVTHVFYRPQRSCGQGYVFTRVCDSVHGGSASVHAGIPPACQGDPPAKETPLPRRPSPCQGDLP